MTCSPRSSADRLLSPRSGHGVCRICFNLIRPAESYCRACRAGENHLDVVLPISYAVGGGWLHTEISAYKRDADPFVSVANRDLTETLERFLTKHERCVGLGELFDVVTTVPSSHRVRDERHPLHAIVERLKCVGRRYGRLLAPSDIGNQARVFLPARFLPLRRLEGQRVLLIDDMWTTGSSAQSAAAVLRAAGAASVSAVVLGRYLNRAYGDNAVRVSRLAGDFCWSTCALCAAQRPRVVVS